jgi:hypothetical protein
LQLFAPATKSAASLTAIALKASAPVPLLVTVIVCGWLDVPASWPPKLMLAGEREIDGSVTLPLSGTACGLPGALSAILSTAARLAEARIAGANITLTVQLAAARRLGGQLLVWEKSAAFVPVILTPLIESVPALLFSRVTSCAALGIPTLCGAKLTLAGAI